MRAKARSGSCTMRCSSVKEKSIGSVRLGGGGSTPHEARDLTLRTKFDDGAVCILLQDPAAPKREVLGGWLIEYANALGTEMCDHRIEIVDLDRNHDVTVSKLALSGKLDQFDDRAFAWIEEGAAQPQFRDAF